MGLRWSQIEYILTLVFIISMTIIMKFFVVLRGLLLNLIQFFFLSYYDSDDVHHYYRQYFIYYCYQYHQYDINFIIYITDYCHFNVDKDSKHFITFMEHNVFGHSIWGILCL